MPEGKVVLITGASRGIGRATALLCAVRGWSVAIHYRNNESAAKETAELVQAAGGRAITVPGDVVVEADVIRTFDSAQSAFGPLDAVVINAGIVAPISLLADMTLERIRRVVDVNVIGAYLCARECARRMPRERGGHGGAIVFVSSAAARLGSPRDFVDYAGSKGAIDTLTVGLAKELASGGVRVNAVRPGLIDTEIHASAGDPERGQRLGVRAPLGRMGRPDEVAEGIVWLLSEASSYVTGSIIDIAGGR